MSTGREIRLSETDDGEWVAVDVASDTTAVAPTRAEALAALGERLDEGTDRRLGDRLAELAVDVDIDSVEAVRELREDI